MKFVKHNPVLRFYKVSIMTKSYEKTSKYQSELPLPMRRNSVDSDHGCTSRIFFDNAGDNVTLTLYNMTLTSQKPCYM